MVRELARYRLEDVPAVLRWPIREALISYRNLMMDAARAAYRHELLVWGTIAPHSKKKSEPPQPPMIIREIVLDG